MARIRTIKPEFPQSESMGRVSRDARLCFIQLWTLADDEGRLRGNSRMLASLLFPYDDDAKDLIDGWLAELEREDCVTRYKISGDSYIQIANWLIHQKIDKPSKSKIPPFDESSRILANPLEDSSGDQGPSIKDQGPISNPTGLLVDSDAADLLGQSTATPCPHQEIIAAYHELLPVCPAIREWTPARQKALRTRWAEDKSRQSIEYWRKLFAYIAESRFLTGRAQSNNGKPPFTASLDWIVKAENFAKIREGRYHKEAA